MDTASDTSPSSPAQTNPGNRGDKDPTQDEMVRPTRRLPAGQELEELRYRFAEEALNELTINAHELRGQAERMFQAVAQKSGVGLPKSTFDETMLEPSGFLVRSKGLLRAVFRRLRGLLQKPSRAGVEGASQSDGDSPPGCYVRKDLEVPGCEATPSAARLPFGLCWRLIPNATVHGSRTFSYWRSGSSRTRICSSSCRPACPVVNENWRNGWG